MKKIDRLMGIVLVLKQQKKLTSRDLADIFEVSERTIYRDIDVLSQLKVPIISYEGFNGGYEIHKDFFLPSISLNENEMFYLLICLKVGEIIKVPNMKRDYESLRYKLLNILDEDIQRQYTSILERIVFGIDYITLEDYRKDIKEIILRSFKEHKNIFIEYYSPRYNETFRTKLTPYILEYDSGGWYVYGYSYLKDESRFFRIDRISSIEISNDGYDQSLIENYLKQCDSEDRRVTVVLKIDNNLYDTLKTDRLFKGHTVTKKNGKIEVQIKVHKDNMWIMKEIAIRNYDRMTVIEPKSLIDDLRDTCKKILEKY